MSPSTSLQTAASAINQYSLGVQAIAGNVANMNTRGYTPLDVNYQSGRGDVGVNAYISLNDMQYQQNKDALTDLAALTGLVNLSGLSGRGSKAGLAGSADQVTISFLDGSPLENSSSAFITEQFNPSKTNLAKEFTDLMLASHAIEANSKVIGVADFMYEQILDMTA